MCGIAGIVDFNQKKVPYHRLEQMVSEMKHRGPDDEGIYAEDSAGLGFVRLSIIDLTKLGHQPMADNSGRYYLVFNGEIFNYLELKSELTESYEFKTKTDWEVILAAYLAWGIKCLDRFNGMWAFAIYDRIEKSLFIARDRFGEKPLYYHQNSNEFIFSSEIKAIYKVRDHNFSINKRIVYEYLAFNRTDQSCETFVNEIQKLNHGGYIIIKDNVVKTGTWYDLNEKLSDPFSSPEEYYSVFESSVALRLRSDVPVGVCLSGGLDSSSVTSVILNKLNLKDIHSFSAVYGTGVSGDESNFINLYKDVIKNLHYCNPTEQTLLNDFDDLMKCHFEPFNNLSIYSQFKVMKDASQFVKVALDGQGADEQLAGYQYFFGSHFRELARSYRINALAIEVYYYLKKHQSALAFKFLSFYLLPNSIKNRVANKRIGWLNKSLTQEYSSLSNLNTQLFDPKTLKESLLQHFEYKLEHNLKWNDLNSMYFSLELRAPFMDHRLVERTLATPSGLIINEGNTKWILREAMKSILPEEIRNRQDKVGFENPAGKWMKNKTFVKLVQEILNSKSVDLMEYIDLKYFEKNYKLHLEGKVNIESEIWKLINLDYFLKRMKTN